MKLNFDLAKWEELLGKKVKNTVGLLEPMNWTDDSDEKPIFSHPKIPVTKYGLLYLETEDSEFFRIQSVENRLSEECEVQLYKESSIPKTEVNSVYGRQDLSFLSGKAIIAISSLSGSMLTNGQEIKFSDGSSIFVFAGEVEVTEKGYMFRRLDDSLLFCRDKRVVESIEFDSEIQIEWSDGYQGLKIHRD